MRYACEVWFLITVQLAVAVYEAYTSGILLYMYRGISLDRKV